MTTVTNYKTQGTNLSDICNTVNQDYYGDVTTGYKQANIDIGTVLCSSTFSTVPGSIVPSGYSASINQYNTGANWNYSNANFNAYSVSISASGQYGIACGYDYIIYYSSNFGIDWQFTSTPTSKWLYVAI